VSFVKHQAWGTSGLPGNDTEVSRFKREGNASMENVLEAQLRGKPVQKQRLRLVCECYTAYHWMPSVLQALRALFTDSC
jgi:hypothetical protein